MADKLLVSILWHQHQPWYRMPGQARQLMPWVRLHATKDYRGMLLLAEKVPEVRLTVNLVPSLLDQLEDYAAGTVTDDALDLSRADPDAMTEAEKSELLRTHFDCHHGHMIHPRPGYARLLALRGATGSPEALARAARQLARQDLIDLQVFFNLVWFHPLDLAGNELLRELEQKGGGYSVADRDALLAEQQRQVGSVIAHHRRLAEAGAIELTTSPYFHPILPLLLDSEHGRRSEPATPLPAPAFRQPADAELQIRQAVERHRELFGRSPAGMWPSEGSVAQELVPLVAREGIRWLASDEDVLARTLGLSFWRDPAGRAANPERLYRPYRLAWGGSEVDIVFRDHVISDLIGFVYSSWRPETAVRDLIGRLETVRAVCRERGIPPMAAIILDGENAWEHFPDGGVGFLLGLYRSLARHPDIETVTVSGLLDRIPERAWLDRLHPGSWISGNFRIWIGHPEKNRAWEQLARVRSAWQAQGLSLSVRDPAARPLMAAEGSDWFWWYGDDHFSPQKPEFDRLFRANLAAAYQALGQPVPEDVLVPAPSLAVTHFKHLPPRGWIQPVLDGRITSYFEWLAAGAYEERVPGGAMHRVSGIRIRRLHYGFSRSDLWLMLEWDGPPPQVAPHVELTFRRPLDKQPQRLMLTAGARHAAGKVLEMAIDWDTLALAPGEEFSFSITLAPSDTVSPERFPAARDITARRPAGDEFDTRDSWYV